MPYTRKGTIFRKKLEGLFGEQLTRLLENVDIEDNSKAPMKVSDHQEIPASSKWTKVDVMDMVLKIVAGALQLSTAALNMDPDLSFAEVRILVFQYPRIDTFLVQVWNGLAHGCYDCQ